MSDHHASLRKVALVTSVTGTMLAIPLASSAHFSNKTLNKGMYSDDVLTLQKILMTKGYYKSPKPTGYFGTTTEKAVKAFQKDKGLVADGLVGPKTKAALEKKMIQKQKNFLKQGDRGQSVKLLQEQLKKLGYYKGRIDGIFGPLTKHAVQLFQSQHRLSIDGIVGPHTYGVLSHHPTAYKNLEKVSNSDQAQTESSRSMSSTSVVKEFYVSSTAYTAYCTGCSGVTATGINLREHPNAKVVAVDPNVIPLGSKLYIEGYGYAVAGDTGGAIKGKRIDLFMANRSDALNWGRRTVKVKILTQPH